MARSRAPYALGISDFRMLREGGFAYVDKTELVEDTGAPELLDGIRGYYNGYLFGGQAIYHPWSVLSFLNRGDAVLRPYRRRGPRG